MRRWLTVAVLAALLAACAGGPPLEPADTAEPGFAPAPVDQGPDPEDTVLYNVLVGELAGARGDIATSAAAYLAAAERSADPAVAERAARIALYAEDQERALGATRRWLELAPESGEAARLLGVLHLRRGDAEAAYEALAGAIPESGAEAREAAIARIGGLLADEARDGGTLRVAERLADTYPDSPGARLAVARVALALEQPERALGAVRAALERRAGWTAARLVEVDALLALEREEDAVSALRGLLDDSPDDETLRLRYARTLVSLGRHVDALEQFERLVRERPDDPQVLYAAGLLALESGRLDFARQCLTRLREQQGQEDVARYYLGRLAELEGEPDVALEQYQRTGGEYRSEAQLRIALALADRGELAQARRHLVELRAANDSLAPRTWAIEGELLREAGRLEESVAVLSRGLEAYPEDEDLLYGRAMTNVFRGRIDAAERDLRRILERDPENAHALNALGYTLVDETERVEEGAALIERAYALRPGDPAIVDSMGWAAYRRGELEEARRFLERAYAMARDPEIAAHLGEILWRLGERERARAVWEEGLALDPEHRVLRETMERLLP